MDSLNLDEETKAIFQYMVDFQPTEVPLKTVLKPFIPEFVPAIGEVDAYLKIPRPDMREEGLGLVKLDEPALNMSKKSYLDLLIKEFYKGKVRDRNKEIHSLCNV